MSDTPPDAGTGVVGDKFQEVYEWVSTGPPGSTGSKRVAKATADRIAASTVGLTISMPGRLDLVAGGLIQTTGFRQGLNGKFKIKTLRHTLTRSGWTMSVETEGAIG